MKNKQKYDKEKLSQLNEIHLAFLSNEEACKAYKIVLMLSFANLGTALIPVLYLKLLCFVLALGYAIYGVVVYVRLDRIGKELKKKYKERKWHSETEEGYEQPCWSLGALLNLLPKQISVHGEKYYLIVSEGAKLPWSICYADVYNEDHPFLAFQKETLVEACIEMIAALKVAEKEEKAIVLWPNVKEEGGEQ